ncbi:DUF485 domain-containing protein [Quatrionicoccus australiensis]|uniref:DUF485 domain-containing protein n=1 Tax=Quatrionicoccus australiensis TaxID=138118 RepID=UPI001CF90E3E|nr:DUF485 domain-containing protein [Quatrionicoccus australiensis]MCB4359711.1 DUF485 domain-containing protein [Quatrionicoccus australiensis]UCV14811.1 DUF485 domain-containing protein [Quatrionicoccus australiensis]
MSQHTGSYAQIRDNPKFKSLIAKRNAYAFMMTSLMMIVYYGYILLIAFNKEWLATKIGEGYTTSIGIPMGLGVIIFTIVLTNIYVRRANTEFDDEAAQVLKEAGQ